MFDSERLRYLSWVAYISHDIIDDLKMIQFDREIGHKIIDKSVFDCTKKVLFEMTDKYGVEFVFAVTDMLRNLGINTNRLYDDKQRFCELVLTDYDVSIKRD